MKIKGYFILFFICINAQIVWAQGCKNALSEHIKEAITHNQSRVLEYASITQNKSLKWSYALISLETLNLPFTYLLDQKAEIYHQNNVNVLCDEIVSMNNLPEFRGPWPIDLRPKFFHSLEIQNIENTIKNILENKNFYDEYHYIESILIELEIYPHQLCLTRHFLESMARTLWLKEGFEIKARNLQIKSPEYIIIDFLKYHLKSLKIAYELDKKVFYLERDEGLPLYCDDVPKIQWK